MYTIVYTGVGEGGSAQPQSLVTISASGVYLTAARRALLLLGGDIRVVSPKPRAYGLRRALLAR